jgi:hypothetical protein
MRFSGTAPQSMARNGRFRRGLPWWIARAANSPAGAGLPLDQAGERLAAHLLDPSKDRLPLDAEARQLGERVAPKLSFLSSWISSTRAWRSSARRTVRMS